MSGIYSVLLLLVYLSIVQSNPQNPEINDQFEGGSVIDNDNTTKQPFKINQTEQQMINPPETENKKQQLRFNETENKKLLRLKESENDKQNPLYTIFKLISVPINQIIEIPKINSVLRNVGTCIVNGVMEIITYYLPSPLIPLIASTAGMMIPFEPIITLRRRMPVASYKRAFKTAVNGFLNTFDRYKISNYDDDPYMTRRFNRRFMNEDSKENNKV